MVCTLRNHILLISISFLLLKNELHAQSPGGIISSPLKLWFKADTGVAKLSGQVLKWNDVSNQGNVMTQPQKTPNTHVIYQQSAANFNPTILFDGTRLEQLKGLANNLGETPTLFTVSRSTDVSAFDPIFCNFEIDPAIPDLFLSRKVGPGLYLASNYYVVDANEAWIDNSANAPAINNTLDIISLMYESSVSTTNSRIYKNGLLTDYHTGAGKPITANIKTIEIGGRSADDALYPARIFNGDIVEIIYFKDNLVPGDRQKVESYLAIKYGITLANNYLSSTGSIIYDVSSFNNNIIGIGKDDNSALNQKQSKGENYQTILTIGLNNIASDNVSNSNSFAADKTFFITGDDNQTISGTTNGVPPGIDSWIQRKWKSAVTGASINNLVISIPEVYLAILQGGCEYVLAMADDPQFINGLALYKMNKIGNSYQALINSVTAGTKYFAFGKSKRPNAGADLTFCSPNTTYDLNAAGPNEAWSLISKPSGSNASVNPTTGAISNLTIDSIYSFQLQNVLNQCSDTLQLTRKPQPLSTANSNSPVCANSSIQLGSLTANFYQWTGPNGFNSLLQNPVLLDANTNMAGSYAVVVTGQNGCQNTSSVEVKVIAKPSLNLGPDKSFCEGSSLTIDATNAGFNSYLWNTGLTSPTIDINKSGTYSVEARASTCNFVSRDTITVIEVSMPSLNSIPDTTVCEGGPIILNASGNWLDSVRWSTGSNQHFIQIDKPGTYYVTAYNICGSAKDTVIVKPGTCNGDIFFPSAFTANNDGLNDFFIGKIINTGIFDFELKVYNRWGQMVFSSKDPLKGWDGTFKGRLQDTSVFVWMAKYRKLNSSKLNFIKGTVLLIR